MRRGKRFEKGIIQEEIRRRETRERRKKKRS